jgi:hypothetical protein
MKRLSKQLAVLLLIVSVCFSPTFHVFAEEIIESPEPTPIVSPTVSPEQTPLISSSPIPESTSQSIPQTIQSSPDQSNDPDTNRTTPNNQINSDNELSPEEQIILETGAAVPEDEVNASTTEADASQIETPEISTDNTASTTNAVTVGSSTGDNLASSTASSTIITGHGIANANVTNVNNVNTVNSNTTIGIINQNGAEGHADLRDILSGSSTIPFADTSTSVTATNTANVTNTVIVRANTGDNHATGTDSLIDTGNAYANANIINILNANIIDSNLIMVIFNSFGNWNGDIVLPTEAAFQEFLKNYPGYSNSTSPLLVDHSNTATVSNNASTDAMSGNNSTSGENGLIQTGDAETGTNIINEVNQNYVGGNAVNLIFRFLAIGMVQFITCPLFLTLRVLHLVFN